MSTDLQAALKLFVRDAIEAAIAVVVALGLTVPGFLADPKGTGITVGTAILTAVIAVARRTLLPWVLDHVFGSAA